MDAKCGATCAAWITSRVLVVGVLFIGGTVGNGLVLKIFYKEKTYASKIYIIAMAWIDLLGCCTTLVQLPFFEAHLMPKEVYMAEAIVVVQAYLFVQLAMVFDRLFAVFLPFKFIKMRRKTNTVLAVLFCVVHVAIQTMEHILKQRVYVVAVILAIKVILLGLMIISYPAMAIKLWKQSRRIKPTAASQHNQPSAATGNPNKVISESQQRTKHHIKTLKLYVAVLTLYLLAFFSTTLVAVDQVLSLNNTWVVYIYYFNSIGNPFIYYVFIEKFRDDVNLMARSIVRRLCSGIN